MTSSKKPIQWVHLSTRPVTYTRVWPKFLNNWQEPEEKTIHGEKWTEQYNLDQDLYELPTLNTIKQLSQKVFGVEMDIHGTWHKTPSMRTSNVPVCPLSGPNHISIRTRPTSSQPDEYEASISGKFFQRRSSPLSSSQLNDMDDFLRSESSSEEQIDSQWNSYQSSEHYEHSIKVQMKGKGQSRREAEWEARVKCGSEGRLCRFESEFQRSPIPEYDSSPFKICTTGEVVYPSYPRSLSDLTGRKVVGKIQTTWGQTCNQRQNNYLNIMIKSQRSRKQQRQHSEEDEYKRYNEENCRGDENTERCSPVSMYYTLWKASRLNSYNIQVEYQNLNPTFRRWMTKYYQDFKHKNYRNCRFHNDDVSDRSQNQRNRVQIRYDLDTQSTDYTYDLTVNTPYERTVCKLIPLRRNSDKWSTSYSFWSTFSRQPSYSYSSRKLSSWSDLLDSTSSSFQPSCHVSSRKIKTFDDVHYKVRLSDCWTVVSKDCQNDNFAVLMKKISPNSSQKKVKILTPTHKIELTSQGSEYGNIKVKVNSEQQSLSQQTKTFTHHQHTVLKIRKQNSGNVVKVSLPEAGIKVYFDGYACNIKSSPYLSSSLCGLCGNSDNDYTNDFYSPEYQRMSDVRSFFQKYTVKDSGCQYPEEVNSICSDSGCNSRWSGSSRSSQSSDYDTTSSDYDDSFRNSYDNEDYSGYSYNRWNSDNDDSSWESQSDQRQRRRDSSSSSSNSQRTSRQPYLRTKVIEQGSKICFSKTRVPRCPHNTYASDYESDEKNVVYGCVYRSDSKAQRLLRKVRTQRDSTPQEIKDLRQSFTEKVSWPTSCTRF
jgi:hypothetical protein